jgi:hypothetical protein
MAVHDTIAWSRHFSFVDEVAGTSLEMNDEENTNEKIFT